MLLQIGAASLLKFWASVATNWGSLTNKGNRYYKIRQLLQIGQVLQIRAVITNWSINTEYDLRKGMEILANLVLFFHYGVLRWWRFCLYFVYEVSILLFRVNVRKRSEFRESY